ncbi:AAA family ATPase [Mycoplasma nasistruthionis]|uniref:AAA family ATPase n=1 Tax=Mycoplasma nasistruthionis TaxID=353852 RepID=A0A4Y6I6P3_9MOLU|nr:AAA family ATPase [Mycoplasma nasistruthionis]QDF65193.1 AAA family ATPase [Mycoplasma nasistruthionis]
MIQSKILETISDLASKNSLNHLFLLTAHNVYNFESDLLDLVNAINLSNSWQLTPNVIHLGLESKTIKKQDLDQAFLLASNSNSTNYKYKILIIPNIENISVNGLNAILKSIEEPSENVITILTTNKIQKILPTILSRAFVIKPIINTYQDTLKQVQDLGISSEYLNIYAVLYQDANYIKQLIENKSDTIIEKLMPILESDQFHLDLFRFINKNLLKDNLETNNLILDFLKSFLLDAFLQDKSNLIFKNLIKNKTKLIKSKPLTLSFIHDIYNFKTNLSYSANFELQKQLLIIKLMEKNG